METYQGYNIEIVPDTDAQSPQEYADSDAFLVAWHRQFFVQPPGINQPMGAAPWRASHWVYLIEAYIHSGITLARAGCGNFPDRRWDVVNPVGFIALSKTEWKTSRSARAQSFVDSLIVSWNQYLSGDVWGYTIRDGQAVVMDSCWGFYGQDYCRQEAHAAVRDLIESRK